MLIPLPEGFAIVVDSNAAPSRQRYSLAHELGHIIAMRAGGVASEQHPRYRADIHDHNNKQEERTCEAIAAELLMPAGLFTSEVAKLGATLNSVPKLSSAFGTSATATAIRFSELNPEPCLLIRWHRFKAGWSTSWQLRNEVPGPRVYKVSTKSNKERSEFESANKAWSAEGCHSAHETVLTSVPIGYRRFARSVAYWTESMGFGGGSRRFVLSAVHLSKTKALSN